MPHTDIVLKDCELVRDSGQVWRTHYLCLSLVTNSRRNLCLVEMKADSPATTQTFGIWKNIKGFWILLSSYLFLVLEPSFPYTCTDLTTVRIHLAKGSLLLSTCPLHSLWLLDSPVVFSSFSEGPGLQTARQSGQSGRMRWGRQGRRQDDEWGAFGSEFDSWLLLNAKLVLPTCKQTITSLISFLFVK